MGKENIRSTFGDLSRFYLRESRSCFNSRAYRMCIVAAATSAHMCAYFRLILDGKFDQNSKTKDFNEVLTELKKDSKKFGGIVEDFEWLMTTRNSFPHPDEWLIPKTELVISGPNASWNEIKLKEKNKDVPKIKKLAFEYSNLNNLEELRGLAEESIRRTQRVIMALGFPYEIGNVNDWKINFEEEIYKITGKRLDLEKYSEWAENE